MFKTLIVVLLLTVAVSEAQFRQTLNNLWKNVVNPVSRLSDITVKDLNGNDVSLADTQGKCVLIINTGSGCGLTNPNMNWLNRITERFPELVVIAFPSNSFNQEKKTEEELKD